MQTIVFATSRKDAQEYCERNDLDFDNVVWVMNVQLLGELTDEQRRDANVHFTADYMEMPAYIEAKAAFQ